MGVLPQRKRPQQERLLAGGGVGPEILSGCPWGEGPIGGSHPRHGHAVGHRALERSRIPPVPREAQHQRPDDRAQTGSGRARGQVEVIHGSQGVLVHGDVALDDQHLQVVIDGIGHRVVIPRGHHEQERCGSRLAVTAQQLPFEAGTDGTVPPRPGQVLALDEVGVRSRHGGLLWACSVVGRAVRQFTGGDHVDKSRPGIIGSLL